VPLLAFAKEWFNPDLAFTNGFLVSLRCLVAFGSVKHFLEIRAEKVPPTVAIGTRLLHWTGIAGIRISNVDQHLFAFPAHFEWEFLPLWAEVEVTFSIVTKLLWGDRTSFGG
jgi:hypothetical protein